MTARYFKDQICEELDGACDYLKKALDSFVQHPEWAEHFRDMADMEQEHATTLYKMFMEMYAKSQGKDSYMTSVRDSIMDCFSTKMRKIEDLKSTYEICETSAEVEEMQKEYAHAPGYVPVMQQ